MGDLDPLGTCTPQCTSMESLRLSIRWYLVYLRMIVGGAGRLHRWSLRLTGFRVLRLMESPHSPPNSKILPGSQLYEVHSTFGVIKASEASAKLMLSTGLTKVPVFKRKPVG